MSSNRFNPLGAMSRSPKNSSGQSSAAPSQPTRPPAQPTQSEPAQHRPKKRKGHRGGKSKRQRRKSFAVLDEEEENRNAETGEGLYQIPSANLSGTSIDSETLLDHR